MIKDKDSSNLSPDEFALLQSGGVEKTNEISAKETLSMYPQGTQIIDNKKVVIIGDEVFEVD